MNLLTKIIKETEEEFDKNVDGNFQGREELDSEEIKRFLRDSQLRLISAFKEMVEEEIKSLQKEIILDEQLSKENYLIRDTWNDRTKQTINRLNKLLSSLTQE